MFKKGDPKPEKSGKQLGSVNEKTKAWDELGSFITQTGAERVREILLTCNENKFMQYYPMLLEYFKPKQNKTQTDLNVNIIPAPNIILNKKIE